MTAQTFADSKRLRLSSETSGAIGVTIVAAAVAAAGMAEGGNPTMTGAGEGLNPYESIILSTRIFESSLKKIRVMFTRADEIGVEFFPSLVIWLGWVCGDANGLTTCLIGFLFHHLSVLQWHQQSSFLATFTKGLHEIVKVLLPQTIMTFMAISTTYLQFANPGFTPQGVIFTTSYMWMWEVWEPEMTVRFRVFSISCLSVWQGRVFTWFWHDWFLWLKKHQIY